MNLKNTYWVREQGKYACRLYASSIKYDGFQKEKRHERFDCDWSSDVCSSDLIEVFCYRLAKSLAAMSCALPQLDGLVFTGGIGENSALIRSRTITHLKLLNLALDEPANARTVRGAAGPIQAPGHPRVMVVPTNEERQIALDTLALLEAWPSPDYYGAR